MDDDVEFYAPWRVTKPYKHGSDWVIWDDNGNPMAYSEDGSFLAEAVRRINAYDDLLAACETAINIDWHGFGAPHVYEQLRAAIAKARGTEA